VRKDYVPEINKPDVADALDKFYKSAPQVEDAINIASLIPPSAKSVLDVGCGTGRLVPHLQEREYLGVDIADRLLEKAKENYPSSKFLLMNVLNLELPNESFDSILCINLLKHLHRKEVSKAFSELVRVCRKGGIIIIRVPIIPETRAYEEYDAFITAQGLDYEDIAFHWSDIFFLARKHGLVIKHPESFLTSKEPYVAPIIVLEKGEGEASCRMWEFARFWRETLMEAERIWQHLLEPSLDLQFECQWLLTKYNYLMKMLQEIIEDSGPECKRFWEYVWMRMVWGWDVLKDFAEYGKIEERGKKAAFERMAYILETQRQRLFPANVIEDFRMQYQEHWFEHPKLAFEIPKASLHEATIDLLAYSRLRGCICPQVARYFAFTRWLGLYPYEQYLEYTKIPEQKDCSSCEENRESGWCRS